MKICSKRSLKCLYFHFMTVYLQPKIVFITILFITILFITILFITIVFKTILFITTCSLKTFKWHQVFQHFVTILKQNIKIKSLPG